MAVSAACALPLSGPPAWAMSGRPPPPFPRKAAATALTSSTALTLPVRSSVTATTSEALPSATVTKLTGTGALIFQKGKTGSGHGNLDLENFGNPTDISVDAAANEAYIADGYHNNRVVVLDAEGKITEDWTQWDSLFRRPHSVTMNPYDPEKHIWIVEDRNHVVYEFSHDGKQLVKTMGVKGVSGTDSTHFNRPTFLAWLPDGTMFVSDGYANTRVVKFDKDGKFLLQWGEKGNPPNDTRPGMFSAVHGVQVDPGTRKVYVTDRDSHRIQVFDENGKFIDQFSTGKPSTPQVLLLTQDKHLWIADNETSKIVKYDLEGHYLYSWGSGGQWPGAMWNVHGMSVDTEGNLYLAQVNNGWPTKFKPRAGANPDFLVGQPMKAK